ncbi:hypothetical protein ACUXSM_004266 [Burkholderia sp. 132550021-2]
MVAAEYLRQHHLACNDALTRQHAAQRGQRDQPSDAADEVVGGDARDAYRRTENLADAHQFRGRISVAKRAEKREAQVSRQCFERKRDARPGHAPCHLKDDQRHEEQQNLVGEAGKEKRMKKGLMLGTHERSPFFCTEHAMHARSCGRCREGRYLGASRNERIEPQ